jgi:hypothetical protein
MVRCTIFLWCLLFPGLLFAQARQLEYAPTPADNPLKGLVPYAGQRKDAFPHSMEFDYVAYSALVKGYDTFDWQPLEKLLNASAQRGKQAIFRIYLEYPKKKNIIPEFLIKDGLKVHKYLNTNTQPFPPADVETPDYENANLRRSLKNFIAAFGKKYDGDPRIAYITAGLLGTWGEWHTYPRSELFASKTVQQEVLDAYEAAFTQTPILLRYPRGTSDRNDASNAERKFGYHDDSFAWATLHTGKKADDWFYMTALQKAGALDKWKTQPIGGEIRPEAWGKVFDANPGVKEIQNFDQCVNETHVSWLMDTGMFQGKPSAERVKRATEAIGRMGYDFQVTTAKIDHPEPGKVSVEWETINRGVAPMYHRWELELGLIADGKVHLTRVQKGRLTKLLPGDPARNFKDTFSVKELKPGKYQVALRMPNPMPTGKPVRFANKTQDEHLPGWITLGEVEIR